MLGYRQSFLINFFFRLDGNGLVFINLGIVLLLIIARRLVTDVQIVLRSNHYGNHVYSYGKVGGWKEGEE